MSFAVSSDHLFEASSPESVNTSLGQLESSGIRRTSEEILALASLSVEAECEQAIPVKESTAELAQRLFEKVWKESFPEKQTRAVPNSVEALSNGSVLLTWVTNGAYTMATIKPHCDEIVVVVHGVAIKPIRESVKFPQALTSILRSLE